MNDHLTRLQAMTAPGQRTWDLSPNDVAAIRWAIDEITLLRARLRKTAQTIIEEIGASGPEDAEESAARAVSEIKRLNAGIGLLLDRIPTSEAAFSREG